MGGRVPRIWSGDSNTNCPLTQIFKEVQLRTSVYATWFTAGGAIRIAHYDVVDDVITRKL